MADLFTLEPFEFFLLHTRTRFPFRYGIASMTEVPHLFVRTQVRSGRHSSPGLTAEGMPPKWFTKDPTTTFEQDLPELFDSVRHATDAALQAAAEPVSFFDLWREVDRAQEAWASSRRIASLVAGLGTALVERAVLDGLCRLAGEPIHRMLAAGRLGLRLGEVYSELEGADAVRLLPASPSQNCFVRHTVGLGDPLTAAGVNPAERVDDGLPQDLEASIRAYGLRYFKLKLCGIIDRDLARLGELSRILEKETAGDFYATVDGNENFADFDAFRSFWERAAGDSALQSICRRTMAIEQPVHRDMALDDSVAVQLRRWSGRPAVIIDESDGAIGDVPRALDLGYAGASYKNCKGIVKGIANACLLASRRRLGSAGLLTGEDLCNLAPVALQQDLAMMAVLGIDHVERNGHHYYRGLSMLPPGWQRETLEAHGDLYTQHEQGFVQLKITEGKLNLSSINGAPFGVVPSFDPSGFQPLFKPALRI